MATSAGKRQREWQKRDRAQSKAERKVARQTTDAELPAVASQRSESEFIEELQTIQQAFEAGEMSPADFEERRDRIQAEFEQRSW
jgi:hypothetical protein